MDDHQAKDRTDWKVLLRKYQKSDQTIAAFCEVHQIKPHIFYYWRRKLTGPAKEEAGSFVALHSGQVGPGIFIRCQNGLELELPGDYPPEALGQLVRILSC